MTTTEPHITGLTEGESAGIQHFDKPHKLLWDDDPQRESQGMCRDPNTGSTWIYEVSEPAF